MYYYFPFLKYHNRWQSDITPPDLTGLKYSNNYKGFVFTSAGSFRVKKLKQPLYTDETADNMDAAKKEVLDDLISYCKRLDQTVIFVSSPYKISKEEQKQLNACRRRITDAGLQFLDYNTAENADRLELNWRTDFMDKKHVECSTWMYSW